MDPIWILLGFIVVICLVVWLGYILPYNLKVKRQRREMRERWDRYMQLLAESDFTTIEAGAITAHTIRAGEIETHHLKQGDIEIRSDDEQE